MAAVSANGESSEILRVKLLSFKTTQVKHMLS